ncbi:patatin-like phospholipase family protein [Crocosphaera sp.]|uniref:patatin-like phospholipase family protein n=1 Tax=Crocosphaera sp. TaxID=2729996 RepID=UPI002605A5C9|nr:patatin-like phospholipase family protein [Crocosphaera sp.]MDJ0580943.1 patatin-like phospholipase family protein [Crocosphaera sp.]
MNISEKKQFKILSLDGGGVRGMISATILKEVERQLEIYCKKNNQPTVKLHDYFDMVAGTSTGSILAAGVAAKFDAEKLIQFYQENAETIFDKGTRTFRNLGILTKYILQIFFPQWCLYPNKNNQGLAKVLQDKLVNAQGQPLKFNEIKEPILFIPAYDTYSRNTTWFASNRKEPNLWFKDIELWKLCVCSAAAPTFFPAYPLSFSDKENLPHIDGGVSANNPSLSAIAHLLVTEKESNLNNISVLSIGTGNTTDVFTYDKIRKWGLLDVMSHVADVFLNPGSQNTEAICKEFLRSVARKNHCNYLRLNFDLNQAFEGERQPGKLRKPIEPHTDAKNEYLGEYISEAIDDPNLCKQSDSGKSLLEKVADAYLQQENISAKIQDFIEDNPPTFSSLPLSYSRSF